MDKELYISISILIILCGEIFGTKELCKGYNKIESDKKGDYYLTGMFPVWSTAPSRFNPNALVYMEMMKFIINEANEKSQYKIGYRFYDSCGSDQLEVAVATCVDILLNDTSKDLTLISNTCTCRTEEHSRNIGVVGAASSTVSTRAYTVLSSASIPMISYVSTSPVLSDKLIYPYFMRSIPSDTYQARVMVDLIVKFNWTYISVIASDDSYGRAGSSYLLDLLKTKNICVAVHALVRSPVIDKELIDVVTKLKNHPRAEVIILWTLLHIFVPIYQHAKILKLYGRTWIMTDAVSSSHTSFQNIDERVLSGGFASIPYYPSYSKFEDYFYNLTYTDVAHHPWWSSFFKQHNITLESSQGKTLLDLKRRFFLTPYAGYVRNAVSAYIVALRNFVEREKQCSNNDTCELPIISNREHFFRNYLKNVTFKGLLNEKVKFDNNGDVTTPMYHILNIQYVRGKQTLVKIGTWTEQASLKIDNLSKVIWSTVTKPKSRCSNECQPGFHPIYGASPCCWDCIPCIEEHIKKNSGQQMCEPCPKNTLANINNTLCLILREIVHEFNSLQGYIILTLILVGGLSNLFCILSFIKFRLTVVVKSSNSKLSIFQLVLQFLLFGSLILFYFDVTNLICPIRLYTIGYLLVLIYSITLIKTEILMRIFNARLRINKRHARITLSFRIFIIAVTSTIFICGQYFLYSKHPLVVNTRIDFNNRSAEKYCDEKVHLIFTAVFVLILALICAVQAFRTRTLPDTFSESTSIMYAVFISVLSLVLMLVLSTSTTELKHRDEILFCLIFCINFGHLLCMYGYKLWILYFRSTRNSTETLRQEIFKRAIMKTGIENKRRLGVTDDSFQIQMTTLSTKSC